MLFLGFAKIIVGILASFSTLFLTVLVPSISLNTVIGLVLYRIVEKSLRRASYNYKRIEN
ncbi:tryptophan transporter [Clostridium perfringens]|uniref:tryptophan transporter n=1 Tax=Clostridium perfringens TaxID=1502 RepID=UPI001CCCE081|nr:tryptophan transporter [Clostridium perfringens]